MDEERELFDVDARVRAALTPGQAVTRRILTAALEDRHVVPGRMRWIVALAVAFGVAIVTAVGLWRWRVVPPPAAELRELAITGNGSVVVVASADGRRWVVGPASPRTTGGSYVIVVSQ
jgi:hypothetical protein